MSELLLGTIAVRGFIAGDRKLHGWLEQRVGDHLHVSAMSIGEVLAQAEAKSDVQQRRLWIDRLTQEVPADFGPRLHGFDLPAAKQWSAVRVSLGSSMPADINPYDLTVVAIALDRELEYVAPRLPWHEQVSGLRQHDAWTGTSYPT